MKYKNILITGGAGCIGSALAEKLASMKKNIIVVDQLKRRGESKKNIAEILNKFPNNIKFYKDNILNFQNMDKYIKRVDVIFHLAALPSHRLALKDPLGYAKTDLIGTVNILETIRLSKNKPLLIFTSTNKVYGKNDTPFNELDEARPCGPYGLAKLQAEEWCHLYHEYYGLNVIVARLFHVIGPRTQPDREISIFTEQILRHEPINVHGKTINDKFVSCSAAYTNLYDVIDGLILLMNKMKGFDIFNIGNNSQIYVEDLARMLMKNLHITVPINHIEMLPHESLQHEANNTKLKKLGWTQKFDPEESIKQYIDWRLKFGKRKAFYK